MGDEAALTRIEQETWLPHVSPSAYRSRPFFENVRPEEVLVGVLDGEVAGYLCLQPATPLASNAHVLMVTGLGVTPSAQRRGVAGGLLEAAETYASERKVERLTLRVLSVNHLIDELAGGGGGLPRPIRPHPSCGSERERRRATEPRTPRSVRSRAAVMRPWRRAASG
jgi:GNAT superfamily N-acetyltransferase